MNTETAKYLAKDIIEKLRGGKVIGAAIDSSDPQDAGVAIRITNPAKPSEAFTVWISADAEGNGAGWLHIEGAKEPRCGDCGSTGEANTACRVCGRGYVECG